jgi:hypothetical protein
MKFKKISKVSFLLVNGFLNNIAQKTNDSIWSNHSRFTPEMKYGIVIYDLNKKKQILSIESTSTAANFRLIDTDEPSDTFGINKGVAIDKTKKRSLKKLTESCKCQF